MAQSEQEEEALREVRYSGNLNSDTGISKAPGALCWENHSCLPRDECPVSSCFVFFIIGFYTPLPYAEFIQWKYSLLPV